MVARGSSLEECAQEILLRLGCINRDLRNPVDLLMPARATIKRLYCVICLVERLTLTQADAMVKTD